MESVLWRCTLVFAGLVAVVNAQCRSTNVLFRVAASPISSTVVALNDVTLTCSPISTTSTTIEFSWHRVNGDVPLRASGQNTEILTIHRVVPADVGEYYCMGTEFGHCAVSNNVMVTVEGATVSFEQVAYTVSEVDGRAEPVLVLSSPSSTVITLQVFSTEGSATGQDIDYDSGPYTVQFNIGVIRALFDVSVNSDNILEGNETFNLTVNASSLPNSVTVGDPGQTTVTIVDNDAVNVSFQLQNYNVNESDGKVEPVLVLSNPSAVNITVEVFSTDGSATGEDYNSGTFTVQFKAETTRTSFSVSIKEDNKFEGNENFTLSINSSSLPSRVAVTNPGQATVTIVDDEMLSVEFDQMVYSGSEASGFIPVTLLLRGGTSTDDITVTVIPSDQSPASAEGNVDYNSTALTAIFTAGSNSTMVNVPVIGDDIAEETEMFDLSFIIHSSLKDQVISGTITNAVVNITDNTTTTVKFGHSRYSVNEDSGTLQFVLVLSNPSSTHIFIEVFSINIEAVDGGVDYGPGPYMVRFLPGEISASFNISITDDDVLEGNERFNLIIDSSSLPNRVTVTTPDHANVTIVDNDGKYVLVIPQNKYGILVITRDRDISISFNQSTYNINEDIGTVKLVLVLSNPSSTNTSVEIIESQGTATRSLDYTGGPYNFIIPAGQKTFSFDISIINDLTVEENENFTVIITTELPSHVTRGNPGVTGITIVDNDAATVYFNQSAYSIVEGGEPVHPVLILSNPSSTNITVRITDSSTTATGDMDYTSGPYTATFSAGSTTASFNVSSIGDNVLESDEKFILTIDPSSLPNNVTTGSSNHSTITILDDEVLMVEFSKPTFSGSETTGAVPVTLMLGGGTSASVISVTVTPFDQSPVSAEGNGRDYTSTPINATFPVETDSIMINVPVTKDNIIEEMETFKLNLSIPSSVNGRVMLGDITTATVTIIDDTNNAVRFGQAMYIVNENDGVVQVLLNLTNPSTNDTIIKVFSANESANGGGVDYGSVPQTVIFPAGITAMFINISITNDIILENNETFALTIDPSSDVISVDPSEATVKIVDDDTATVSFNQSVYSVDENGGLVQPVIVLSNPSSTVITIQVTDIQPEVEGSALLPPGVVSDTDVQVTATGGDDYMPGPYNVSILAGQTHVVFDVSIMNDTTIESNESFTLAIIPESLPEQIKIEIPDRTTITIVDNDVATVFFGQSMYSVSENIGLAQPEIVLSNPSSTDITVQVTVYNGTATEGVDYASGSYNIEIPAGQTHVEFNVTIMDDNTVESDEYFLLVITSGSLPNKFSPGDPNITNVTIVENDVSTVFFTQSTYTFVENITTVELLLNLSNPLSSDIIVQVTDDGNTATAGGDDYNSGPYNVTFTAGMTSSSLVITINDDNMFEDNENFVLKFDSVPSIIAIGDPREATLTILDNEVIMVQFSNATYSGSEESGVVPVTLLLEGGTSPFVITVTVIPSDQSPVSAEGNGVDYISTPVNATFAVGSSYTTINISVIKDSILEPPETFSLSFSVPPSLRSQIHTGSLNTASASIKDSTVLMVQFSQTTYSGSETSGAVHVMLLLRGGTSTSNITVTVMLSDISAKGNGVDYISIPINATFASGSTDTMINVPITMDHIVEESETFSLSFTIPSPLSGKVIPGNITTANATITDDTMTSVNFSQSAYSVDENDGIVQLTLVLSIPSSSDITIEVFSTDGSAIGDSDYLSGPYTAKFDAGMTSASFNVSITDNNILEIDENFELVIDMSSLPIGVTVGIPAQVTVTIVDDDTATVSFEQHVYNVNETDGNFQPVVVLSNPSMATVTVEVFATDGSATGGGEDYDFVPYTVEFSAGVTRIPLNVSINDDNIFERNEIFNLTINKSSLPKSVTVDRGEVTVTIVDDDFITVTFNESSYNVSEEIGTVQLILLLSNPSSINFTVHIRERENTAKKNSDYGAGKYSVTFYAEMTLASVDINITNDDIFEDIEFFTVAIMGNFLPNGVSRGTIHNATITIVDIATVRFEQSTYSVDENSELARPSIILEGDSLQGGNSITVEVFTTDGSATGDILGGDYASRPFSITFISGVTIIPLKVPIIDDDIYEGNENFSLTIDSSKLPNIIVGDPNEVVVIILDGHDVPAAQFQQSMYTVNENEGLQPVLVLTGVTSIDVTVQVFTADGSATGYRDRGSGSGLSGDNLVKPDFDDDDGDYFSGPYTITFKAGNMIGLFNISIIDDNIFEINENFTLTISSHESVTVGELGQAKVIIVDDDTPSVSFELSTYTVHEHDESVMPVLVLSNPSSIYIRIAVLTFDGSATGNNDYVHGPYTVEFPARMSLAETSIQIINDTIFEDNENFTLSIDLSSLPGNITVGKLGEATVTIIDDDPITISFNESSYSVNEAAVNVHPVLVLSNPSSTNITVRVLSTADSATALEDYLPGPYNVTFIAGMISVPLYVAIFHDNTSESDERFNLTIDTSSLPSSVTVDDPDQVRVTIVDDSVVTIMFEHPTYNVNEADEKVEPVIVLSNPSSTDITVEVFTTEESATGGGVDFYSGSHIIKVDAGLTTIPFNVSIKDDDIFEDDETFNLSINSSSLPNKVIVGNHGQTVVTIEDNDNATVSFNQSVYSVNENDGEIQVVLVLSNPSSTDIIIQVVDNSSTALGEGDDYDSGPYNATFAAGITSASFVIPIINDGIREDNEDFILIIDSSPVPVDDPDQVTVTIVDSDAITVFFNESSYSVVESNGVVQPVLVLNDSSSTDIMVNIFELAIGAEDYSSGTYSVIFTAGVTVVSFDVPITDNNILESNMNFSIAIDPSSLPNRVTVSDPDQASVTVVDDDDVTVSFMNPRYSFDENNVTVQLVLVLTNPSSTDITLQVANDDNTTTGGVDYIAGPYPVNFPTGHTNATLNVTIIDDNISEGNENFNLTIESSSLPSKVNINDLAEAIVTIVDNEVATVSFKQSTYSISENDPVPLKPVLVLSKVSSVNITVQIRDNGNTAVGGNDYDSGPYSVTFPAGTTEISFDITIYDDRILEDKEEFILSIDSTPLSVGAINQATVTIVDNDVGTLSFKQSEYNIEERNGPLKIELILSNPSSTNITVEIENNDNTATDEDYHPGPYTTIIPAGETSASFIVNVIDDNVFENTEDFSLTFRDSLPLNVIGANRATVTIMDDDGDVVVSFNQSTYTINENDGPVQPVITLSNPSSFDVSIRVRDAVRSATRGDDYISGPYPVIIPAGQTHIKLNISVTDDNVPEDDKNFDLIIIGRSLSKGFVRGEIRRIRVIIVDDDKEISFKQQVYSINETDGNVQPTLILSNALSITMIVEVFSADGSATGEEDYTSGPFTVEFNAGVTRVTFNVSISNDNILEGNETFNLIINPSSLPSEVTVTNPNQTIVTIVDNDVLTVQFSKSSFSSLETSGFIPVTLLLGGGTSSNVITVTVIPFDQSPVSAQGNEIDYTSTPITATFSVGTNSTTINVPVTKDIIAEEMETFNLNFSLPLSVSGKVIPGVITTATGSIVDDTEITVKFGQEMYTIDENNKTIQVSLILSNPSSTAKSIKVFATNESANGAGIDYDSGPFIVMIPAEMTSASFSISITNDDILEQNETFALTIDTSSGFAIVDPDKAVVTIVDDDTATVSFNQSVYSVDENGGLVQPVIVLSNPSSTVITIQVTDIQPEVEGSALLPPGVVPDTDMQDTATGGDDYMPGPYNVSILAGQTYVVFDVSIMNDTTIESNENFTLAIIPESLPEQIKIEIPDRTTITIVDNDVPCLPLTDPSNGMISCSLEDDAVPSYGDTCSITCNTGYELTGSDTRTCQSDGSWSGSIAMCSRVSCPSLDSPSNGMINCSLEDDPVPSYEDTCNFTCNTGYELTGSETRTCQSDGSWSGSTAMCSRVSCPSLDSPSNGMLNCSLGDDIPSYEDTCNFTCNTGYELIGSETRTCQSNGSWSGSIAICSRISCPPLPVPSNGMINCSLGDDEVPTYEDTCSIICNTGYNLTGSETRTCQSDGSWSGSIAMCGGISCPPLPVPSNGMINCSLGDDEVPTYEDTCSIICNTGYNLTGSETRTCQSNGSWSGSIAMCSRRVSPTSQDCQPLTDPSNGMINCSLGDEVPSYEDTCNFTCNTGYELTGSDTRTCQSDGSWSGSIAMCSRVSCPSLDSPSNGTINCLLGDDGVLSYEDACSFTCDTGYELTGSDTRTCQNNGSWSGSNAMCTIECTIKGQIIKQCASYPNCTKTCNNTLGSIACAQLCLPNGCDCPDGMVVDEENNECIDINDCPTMPPRIIDVCLIKGQIRKECASHPDCAKTCSNTGELLACSERCIPNGCECPDGTVIDVDKNECVELGECPVVNIFVGENVKVGVGKQIIMDCGPLIDATEVTIEMINWIHNANPLSNESAPNVVISQDTRQCIITETSLSFGGQLGNGGNYTCEVCSDLNTCMSNSSIIDVCGEPNLVPPSSPALTSPFFASLTCGQNVTLPSTGVGTLIISCAVFNGSDPITTEVFKNGVSLGSIFSVNISPFGDDDFGNYTFVASTKKCGSTSAVSWIRQECPIEGQIRTECAPHPNCTKSCKDIDEPLKACPEICVVNGCECPNGTVVDEKKNACIPLSECPASVCPIKKQIRQECALHPNCTKTCNNTDKPVDCPDVCIFNGCECPNGTVVNEENMECVPRSECPGICNITKITGKVRKNKNNNRVTIIFSADHPDAFYTCRIDGGSFMDCESPLRLKQNDNFVIVRAFCPSESDEQPPLQKRRKFNF